MHNMVPTIALISAVFLVACDGSPPSTTNSDKVTTKEMQAFFDVFDVGDNNTTIEARIKTDISSQTSFVNLVGNDKLVVHVDFSGAPPTFNDNLFNNLKNSIANEKSMETGVVQYPNFIFGNQNISGTWYFTSFPREGADATFTLRLERDNGAGAPNSTVTMPTAFMLTSPNASQIYRLNQAIDIAWTPSGTQDIMSASATQECLDVSAPTSTWKKTLAANEGDPGVISIPANTFSLSGANCWLNVLVERTRIGHLDAKFKNGYITARQLRSVKFFVQ